MSDPLVLEPTPTAKVILHTNFGPLSLELFGAQCPLTVRSFLTHCYNSYYAGTIFHRLVPGFILQGGDPTNTGHGGDSIYPTGLPDEFHQRIKFNRRGMLGMANGGKRNDNGSQFFLTLAPARELDGRNTCFGRVEGETVYNLVRMAEQECVPGTERPEVEIRVSRTEVIVNPFPDIVPPTPADAAQAAEPAEPAKKKMKKKKPLGRNILSFAGDDEPAPPVPVKKKTFDPRIVAGEAPPKSKSPPPPQQQQPPSPKAPSPPPAQRDSPPRADTPRTRLPSPPPAAPSTKEQIRQVRAALARRTPTPPPAQRKPRGLLELQRALLPATAVVGRRKRKRRGEAAEDDEEALAAIARFRAKLASAEEGGGGEGGTEGKGEKKDAGDAGGAEDEEEVKECDLHFIPGCESCRRWEVPAEEEEAGDDGRDGLWGHRLTFEKDRKGKDLAWKKKNEELVVIDPREKTREIVERRREGRRGGPRTVRDVGRR